MNSEIYSRICALYARLGIDMANGSDGRGEAAALAAGFDVINSVLDDIMKNIFVQTADDKGLRMFLSLIHEKPAENADESRKTIADRLSNDCGYLSYSRFEAALRKIGSTGNIRTIGNSIIIPDLIDPLSRENLIQAGRFVRNYKPVFCSIRLVGSGIDFDTADSLEMPWYQMDEVNLPFNMLEQLQ